MSSPIITFVETNSIADELGIVPGDLLINMNGELVCDVFDYRFHSADGKLTLTIGKQNGEIIEFSIEKDEMEDLGLDFENPLIDEEKGCSNHCVFCFIDQLPKGMRKSLYFKDDDARLSFLYGNYITMTNMKDEEIDRIIRYRMSPINVSVHTTNPDLRVKMLGNRFAGNIMKRIDKLVQAGITVNAQIVLCRGWNDGIELDRSLEDMSKVTPLLHSISVVPIGLTKYREGLPEMKAFDKKSAAEVIKNVEEWQERFLDKVDSRTVYAADEFYLTACLEIPGIDAYEDFPQIENGVGMLSSFRDDFLSEWSFLQSEGKRIQYNQNERITIATGEAAYQEICFLVKQLKNHVETNDEVIRNIQVIKPEQLHAADKIEIHECETVANQKDPHAFEHAANQKESHVFEHTANQKESHVFEHAANQKESHVFEQEGVQVISIKNNFFGGHVSVTGLLTGQDLMEQLKNIDLGSSLLLCRSMFRTDTEVMLDDKTKEDLERELGVPVIIVDPDGSSLLHAILRINVQ